MNSRAMFRERLLALMAERGSKPADLARAVGKSPGWASLVLNGKRNVPMVMIDVVAKFLQVEPWRLLVDDAGAAQLVGPRDTTLPGFKALPWLHAPIAAGRPLSIERDEDRDQALAFQESFVNRHPTAICLTVGRNQFSMSPTIVPGDVVVIDRAPDVCRTPRSGQVYAINFAPLTGDPGGAVKRVELRDGHLVISSDNSDKREYPTEVFDAGDINLLDVLKGQVVWFGRNVGDRKGK